MAKRKIIKIDEEKCNGCGQCIPNCPEGALQIIDGKARLVSDLFCDGLGTCIGHCPQGAITIEEREGEAYDERKAMANIVKQGQNVLRAHLEHLQEHHQAQYLQEAINFLKEKDISVPLIDATGAHQAHSGACPGSQVLAFTPKTDSARASKGRAQSSQLRHWPIQLQLVPSNAPYFQDADLLIAADCVPFAYADFHQDLLADKILLVGCPKLDDAQFYQEKLAQIFTQNKIKAITCAHMEVPCCFGLVQITKEALAASGKALPFKEVTISMQGKRRTRTA